MKTKIGYKVVSREGKNLYSCIAKTYPRGCHYSMIRSGTKFADKVKLLKKIK